MLDAAAEIVATAGVEGLSISALHLDSGVSTGSIYHHFGSKDGIVAGLIGRSYREWRRTMTAELRRYEDDPAAAIRAAIGQRLAWGEARRGEARLVLGHRGSHLADPWATAPRKLVSAFDVWLREQARGGRLPPLDAQLALAVVFGPADDVLRAWLDDPQSAAPTTRADALAGAAWAGLQEAGRSATG